MFFLFLLASLLVPVFVLTASPAVLNIFSFIFFGTTLVSCCACILPGISNWGFYYFLSVLILLFLTHNTLRRCANNEKNWTIWDDSLSSFRWNADTRLLLSMACISLFVLYSFAVCFFLLSCLPLVFFLVYPFVSLFEIKIEIVCFGSFVQLCAGKRRIDKYMFWNYSLPLGSTCGQTHTHTIPRIHIQTHTSLLCMHWKIKNGKLKQCLYPFPLLFFFLSFLVVQFFRNKKELRQNFFSRLPRAKF